MKNKITLLFCLLSIIAWSESTITFPAAESINGTKKNLILKITIPNEMEEKEEDNYKKSDFSYFDFTPFEKVDNSVLDYDILKHFPKKGLVDRTRTRYLCTNKAIRNEYDLFQLIGNIVETLDVKSKDEMLGRGVTREDLQYIEKLIFKDYVKYFSKTGSDKEKVKKRIAYLKKQFLAGKGEVRVLRVETNDAGETMIHIRLNEEE